MIRLASVLLYDFCYILFIQVLSFTDTLVKQACHPMHVSCGSGILLLLLVKQMKQLVLRYVAEDGYMPEVYLAIVSTLSEGVVWEMGWFTW